MQPRWNAPTHIYIFQPFLCHLIQLPPSLEITCHRSLALILDPINSPHIIRAQCPLTIGSIPASTILSISMAITLGKLIVLLHLHLGLVCTSPEFPCRVFGVHRGQEVDEEGEDVEGEDECDGPFEDCGCVVGASEVCDAEGDGENDFG